MPDNTDRADRILNAASKLIVHYGYDKTTMSDIAHEARVSKGALYLHWSSKEDLFETLLLRESERVLDDMLRRIENDPDGGTIFTLYLHAIVAAFRNPLVLALTRRDHRVIGDLALRWNGTGLNEQAAFLRHEFVEQLQAAGVIRKDLDADVLAYILSLIRYGFLTINDVIPLDEAPPIEEVARALAAMLDRALSPEGGADREAGKRVVAQFSEMMRTMLENYRQEIRKRSAVK